MITKHSPYTLHNTLEYNPLTIQSIQHIETITHHAFYTIHWNNDSPYTLYNKCTGIFSTHHTHCILDCSPLTIHSNRKHWAALYYKALDCSPLTTHSTQDKTLDCFSTHNTLYRWYWTVLHSSNTLHKTLDCSPVTIHSIEDIGLFSTHHALYTRYLTVLHSPHTLHKPQDCSQLTIHSTRDTGMFSTNHTLYIRHRTVLPSSHILHKTLDCSPLSIHLT